MKKKIFQIILWTLSIFFGFKIYNSINDPIKFKKEKVRRYAKVINRLEMVRNAQEAYKSIQGIYAPDFESLIRFVDTAKYTITQQRDTSWMEYDKIYRIDMLKQGIVIDTLGHVSVRDSLFSGKDIYKSMTDVPGARNGEKVEMKTSTIITAGYKQSVFMAKVSKDQVLWDQPEDLVSEEKKVIGVDNIDGADIIVGSLEEMSTTGNWPSIYDTARKK